MLWRTFAHAVALACVLAVFVAAVALPRAASAQSRGAAPTRTGAAVSPPGSIPVLTFETDDADDQADAFTGTLRAKLKATPGWTLSENTFSLAILTAALKCRADAPSCLQRVGEQLKADKFFWGRVSRLGKTQVVVEAHYWQKGKHDSVVKETYSDDLRNPNNDALKKIASRVFERLTNTMTTGTLAVTAGRAGGTVYVDGAEATQLAGGFASVELKAGSHTVEVRAPGFIPVRRTVNVVVGTETPVSIALAADPGSEPTAAHPSTGDTGPSTGNGRKVAAYTLIGGGVAAGAVGVIFGVQWLSKQSGINELRSAYTDKNPCAPQPGASPSAAKAMDEACRLSEAGVPLSAVGLAAGAVGAALVGTGIYLLVTGRSEPSKDTGWTLAPALGPREGSLRLHVSF